MCPILYEDKEKKKALALQFDRCKGCGICIEICPRKILTEGKELNTKVQYPPVLVEGGVCTFCRECELICPDFALYILENSGT
ncbi:MAG: 4Fe-4S binding protein [Candidatus Helarchaeota archaeon]